MPDYKYRALNPRGRIQRGLLNADSPHDLTLQLQQAGMALIEARATLADSHRRFAIKARYQLRDMAQLCRHFSQLEQAAVPLTESLDEIRQSLPAGALRQTLHLVRRDIESGSSLSQALARRPAQFRAPMPALVGAGEATGRLAQSFDQLARHFDWQQNLRAKLTRTLGYPVFAFIAMLTVVLFLLVTVIPETSKFLADLNVKLPVHTLALIAIATFARDWGAPIAIVLGLAITALMTLRKRSAVLAYWLDAQWLRLPILGAFLQKLELARFTQNIAMMLDSGIDLLPALGTATNVIRNRAVRENLEIVSGQLENGLPLSRALGLSGLFSSLVLRIVRIGEEGGGLPASFTQIATYYENDVQHGAELMVSALGPLITLMTGSLLVWLIVSVFMPIYDALPQLM